MYKYIYVESENEGLLSNATHREIAEMDGDL